MRFLMRYLVFSGVLAHLGGLGVYLHFASTGATLHRYVSKGVEYLDRNSSPTRHLAQFTRVLLLDSGLIEDPVGSYPPDLEIELPPWRGLGASTLRKDTAPRYARDGAPIPMTSELWPLTDPPALQTVKVATTKALEQAIQNVQPGTEIRLSPGHYLLDTPLQLAASGTARQPLVLRGDQIGSTVLEFSGGAHIAASGSHWTLSDLTARGRCPEQNCGALVRPAPGAAPLTVRNVFVSGVHRLVRNWSARDGAKTAGLVDGVTIVGGEAAAMGGGWEQSAVREIPLPPDHVVLCPKVAQGPDCDTEQLGDAVRRLPANGLLLIRSGTYRQAAYLNKPGVHLVAEPGARLYATSTGGKGALVVQKDVIIEGLECSHIKVGDGNGCCVRQDSGNVTLIGVHFHHSQMGMLTGHKGGEIRVVDSYFHDNGYGGRRGRNHNLYINSGTFDFIRSWSLVARNAGHEIKSRAERTTIRDSLIASLNARDSRLIDLPNGGHAEVTGSILGEGPRSENWDLIGYGLEARGTLSEHGGHRLKVARNTIFVDRPAGAKLVNASNGGAVDFIDNVVVGDVSVPRGNAHFSSRPEAGVFEYPSMPALTF